ncbi:cell wall-binding repeat-containing protein [Rossellomorea arthrocnemi]
MLKRCITIVLVLFLTLQAPFLGHDMAFAEADVTKPIFNGVKVDKHEGVLGDSIKVSVDAEDLESGIKYISIRYTHPGSERTIYRSINSPNQAGVYEAEIIITNEMEEGLYQLSTISIYDNAGNEYRLYNSNVFSSLTPREDLSIGDFTVSGTNADVTKPSLKAINVLNKEGALGEKVIISIEAEDSESGINYVSIRYQHPISDRTFYRSINTLNEEGKYEAEIEITNEMEEGLYQLSSISIYDNAGNEYRLYNSNVFSSLTPREDLSIGDFTVSGTNADVTKPSLKAINVLNEEGALGEKVIISIEAEDLESGINYVSLRYQHPISDRTFYRSINTLNEEGKYEAEIEITNEMEEGLYQLSSISIYDNAGNEYRLYNSNVFSSLTPRQDLSTGNFRVISLDIPPNPLLEKHEVVYYNQTWSSKTIQGDVYVGPDAVLKIDGNVKINGDVYVLGVVNNHGNLTVTGKITAQRYLWGSSSSSRGTVNMLGGTNHISQTVATNKILHNVPIQFFNEPLTATNGKVNIEGATLPIISMKVEGDDVPLNYNGTFKKEGINVGDKESLTITFIDVFGNQITEERPLSIVDTIDPTVTISPKGGYYASKKTVEITLNERGDIYYTLDGEEPSKTSSKYESPLTIQDDAVLKVIAYDRVGNPSEIQTEEYEFLKVEEVTDKSTFLKGKAKAGSIITINTEDKEWKGTVDEDGNFQIEIPVPEAGDKLTVYATDPEGTKSETLIRVVQDVTAPSKPEVDAVTDQSTEVTGTAEVGAKVTIRSNGHELGSSTAGGDGRFTITIPVQPAGVELVVSATDLAGNASDPEIITVKDITPPGKPEVNEVTDQATKITGTAEAGTKVVAKVTDNVIGNVVVNENGDFSLSIEKQPVGTSIEVFVIDPAGLESGPVSVTVQDVTNPSWPQDKNVTISENTGYSLVIHWPEASDNDGIQSYILYKNGERALEIPSSKQSAKVENLESGRSYHFELEAVDLSGNHSFKIGKDVQTKDIEKPVWPVSNQLQVKEQTENSIVLKWPTAEDNVRVETYMIYLEGKLIHSLDVDTTEVRVSNLSPGKTYDFEVVGKDAAGNESEPLRLQAKTQGQSIKRIAGNTRFSTAAEISKDGWKTADTVLLARGHDFPDALAGAPLAYQLNAPVLLTDKDFLNNETMAELKRLEAKKVIILGGKSAVSTTVEKSLKNMNLDVDRIAGANRFETAAMIADRMSGKPEKAILTYGYNFPDALAVASYAASKGYPILLTQKNELPKETKVAITGVKEVFVIGGRAVISDSIQADLPIFTRISGSNRYETAINIIEELQMSTDRIYVATGTNFADALTGSVLAAKHQAPILLVKQNEVPAMVDQFIHQNRITDFTILGGESAVGNIIR